MKPLAVIAFGAGLAFGVVTPAGAEEAKTPVSATLVLDIVSAPVQSRRSAFDEALARPAPPSTDSSAEVLPDGSVRYGRTVITVKNPCPPGTHDEPLLPPRPLPGRRR